VTCSAITTISNPSATRSPIAIDIQNRKISEQARGTLVLVRTAASVIAAPSKHWAEICHARGE
jgi:hypothetical protein